MCDSGGNSDIIGIEVTTQSAPPNCITKDNHIFVLSVTHLGFGCLLMDIINFNVSK